MDHKMDLLQVLIIVITSEMIIMHPDHGMDLAPVKIILLKDRATAVSHPTVNARQGRKLVLYDT